MREFVSRGGIKMITKSATQNLSQYLMMSSANEMFDIVAPLQTLMEITHFSYHKVYKDSTRIHISSHPKFIDVFHANKFYDLSCTSLKFDNYQSGYYLVSQIMTKELKIIIDATLQIFDYSYPFTIIKKFDDYCEFYYFSTSAGNIAANNFYLNHIDIFESFILYFKTKAADLLKKIDSERFIYPVKEQDITNPFIDNFTEKRNKFFDLIDMKTYFIPELNLSITKREMQCLGYVKRGYTAKAIARQMNVSTRTVETHIDNLKSKLHTTSKQTLADLPIRVNQNLIFGL
jgi:LuxR family quorum-sensing system transcriptional regulator SolR